MIYKKVGTALLQAVGASLASMVGGLIGALFAFFFVDCLTATCSDTSQTVFYGISSTYAWAGAWGAVIGLGKLTRTQGSLIGSLIGSLVGLILTIFVLPEETIIIAAFVLPTLGYHIFPPRTAYLKAQPTA